MGFEKDLGAVGMKRSVVLRVNGKTCEVFIEPSETLLDVLREKLRLTGAKRGCDVGDCESCTVLIDGRCVPSCLVLAISARGKDIVTIEGLAEGEGLHPLQQAFMESGAVQCGFCIPGLILIAKALLDENPKPSEEDVRRYLSGIFCRCGAYTKIVKAVLSAAHG